MIGIRDYKHAGELQEKWEKEQERLNSVEPTKVNIHDKHTLKLAVEAVQKAFGKPNHFLNKDGRKIEVNSLRITDGGTLVEFDGFYLDGNFDEITDDDYYYIQETYYDDLYSLASEGY